MSTEMLKYIMIITVVLFVGIIIAYVILKKMMGKSCCNIKYIMKMVIW